MTVRIIVVLAVLVLPCMLAAEPPGILHSGEPPSPAQEMPDSTRVNPLTIMMRTLTPREDEGGFSLPFGLDRLFFFSNFIDGFEFPGGISFDVGLDRIGIGFDF